MPIDFSDLNQKKRQNRKNSSAITINHASSLVKRSDAQARVQIEVFDTQAHQDRLKELENEQLERANLVDSAFTAYAQNAVAMGLAKIDLAVAQMTENALASMGTANHQVDIEPGKD